MLSQGFLSHTNQTKAKWVAVVAIVLLLVGTIFAFDRVWSNLLLLAFYLLTVGLGGAVFVALSCVSGAGWNVAFRRVPEALAGILPIAGSVVLLVLAMRVKQYGWHHHGAGDAGTFWFKELWLTPWFWMARSILYVVVWAVLGRLLIVRSRSQSQSKPQISAFFLVVYAITFSLASADWLMALDPLWFSTMWGVYHFAGMMLATLAVITLLCLLLSTPGRPLSGIFSTEHLHDLGRLLVGFSCFWMYIWFSQYMLIWYSNIPEETSYFMNRTHGPWGPIVIVSIVLNWFVPFFLLLPKPAKRNRTVMARVATVLLIGRWVDLYVMVFPSVLKQAPVFGVWETAGLVCFGATGVLLVDRTFRLAEPVPVGDPYLAESLDYHA